MSRETYEWLNNFCLIGFTDKRGHAWHYRENAQGAEANHYPGAIPIEEVQRRLFNWTALEQPISTPSLVNPLLDLVIPGRKAIVASDNGDVLAIFKDSYHPHQYAEWLLNNVANLIDDDLGIGSALLLRNRGVGVVQIELPENFKTPEGVEYRPNLLAATSLDGTLRTTYKRTITVAVCDNTTEQGLSEVGQQYKIKHTRNSGLKIAEARSALNLIFESQADFDAEIRKLCSVQVTQKQWQDVLDALVPISDEDGAGRTRAQNKQSQLRNLWANDARVAPWKNTAWGVAQAFNTHAQHLATVKNVHRAERNFDNVLSGKTAAGDNMVLAALSEIVDKSLITAV